MPKCTLFCFFLVSPAITVSQGEVSSPQRVTASQQQTRISASSATRELDELMASLSDFKVPHLHNLCFILSLPMSRVSCLLAASADLIWSPRWPLYLSSLLGESSSGVICTLCAAVGP